LRNQDYVLRISLADRMDDGGRVLRKTRAIIRRGQFHRDSLMSVALQLRRDEMPVPCAATRARNQDEGDAVDDLALLSVCCALGCHDAFAIAG
jgi:hypothetical protein